MLGVGWQPQGNTSILEMIEGASVFSDDIWNLSALIGLTKGWTKQLDFVELQASGISNQSILELKITLFLTLNEPNANLPTAGTFVGKFYALRALARYANALGVSLFGAAESKTILYGFLLKKRRLAVKAYSVFISLRRLHPVFQVDVPREAIKGHLARTIADFKTETKQTAVIPQRVYLHVLTRLLEELLVVEEVADLLLERVCDPDAGKPLHPVLREYGERLGYNFCGWNNTSLAGALSNIYVVCQCVIAANTGMRIGEVESLCLCSLEIFVHGGTNHWCIHGTTTKLNGGRPKKTMWVTNEAGARAINLAEKIARAVHELNRSFGELKVTSEKLSLFPRHGIANNSEYAADKPGNTLRMREALFARLSISINAMDVAELKHIDQHRDWELESDFEVRKLWPLAMHQFRRSLAIYAHRSGLVTLPALKAQLQHLTQEMSMYYTRGSAFARILSFEKDHIAHEWNSSGKLSAYLGFSMDVLMSDEPLFGGAAKFATSSPVANSPVSVHSREHGLKMFERGEIAYRETIIGGCMATLPCKSSPLSPIPFSCLKTNCANLVVIPRKLDRTIREQSNIVAKLAKINQDSVEYRFENEGLKVLLSVQLASKGGIASW